MTVVPDCRKYYEMSQLAYRGLPAAPQWTDSVASSSAGMTTTFPLTSPHLSLDHEGRWGITDDFTTIFLRFSLFSTALYGLVNSRPVHSLVLFSHLFFCLPCLLLPFTCAFQDSLPRPDVRGTCRYHCCLRLLRWSGGLRVVRLSAGSLHGLPRR